MSEPVTIASEYLAGLRAANALDEALCSHLAGGLDFDTLGDDYDGSLELFVPLLPVERVAEVGAFVLSLGFARCWVHRHEGQRDKCVGTRCTLEHYFSTPVKP